MHPRRATFWGLYVPPVAWIALFFLIPVALMFALSFRADMQGDMLAAWSPTLAQYEAILSIRSYWRLLATSIFMAFAIAVAAVALAYPVAYFLVFRAGRAAGLCLVILMIPFWTSFLLRVMSWKFMLGSEGVLNSLLMHLNFVSEPLEGLLYSRQAVIITLIYVWIPFATLPIYAVLQRIDSELLESAADLGARPSAAFRAVTLPLSLPGVLAAFFMVFIPTVGEYVTPLLIGGSSGSMYGNIIQDFFTKAANWPRGAALSMVMLAVTLVLVAVAARLVNLRRLLS
ncbi:MAG: ABC transporter permease [Gammaproteobacteria bacterium]